MGESRGARLTAFAKTERNFVSAKSRDECQFRFYWASEGQLPLL